MTTKVRPLSPPQLETKKNWDIKSPILKIKDSLSSTPTPNEALFPTITKPVLTVPQYGIIASLERLHEIGNKRLKMHIEQMDAAMDKLKALTFEHVEKLKLTAERTQSHEIWDVLRRIGSCLLSAFTAFFGITVAASGGSALVAGALVTSGILSLANFAFSETGVWSDIAEKIFPNDVTKRNQFLNAVPLAVGLVSCALGVVGGVGLLRGGEINLAEKLFMVVNTAVNIAEGIITIGETATRIRITQGEIETKKLEIEMFLAHNSLDKIKGAFERLLKTLSNCCDRASHIIDSSTKASHEITLRG